MSGAVAAALKGNEALFSPDELALVEMLLAEGQEHLFAGWPAAGTQDDAKKRMIAQVGQLDGSYHGGLKAYIQNAKKLLSDSKEGRNPFDGYTPEVPHGEKLDYASDAFMSLEERGIKEVGHAAFVLVAGGLGERLGYSGIKVALPAEYASGRCFLQLYIEYILAFQAKAAPKGVKLPLAIMTSGDTHDRTVQLLESNAYFGADKAQITLIKQEKVACLTDNDAHLALEPSDPYTIQTKPHGHGDVHALLHSSGLAAQWKAGGFKWVCFFQDTNALVFRALLVALGVSAKYDYDMNSLAVPRKAKESIGAIAKLVHKDGGSMTVNVEYNQLDPLLRSTINPEGDVNDATGWSPFPGNLNQLVLKLDTYVAELNKSGGVISEFVNPKYADATKTKFKSSTRLECMMQDYPKALPPSAKVGFTVINQVWATYSPVKNSPADAKAKADNGDPTHSATTGEMDIYKANCLTLKMLAGADIGEVPTETFNGIPVESYPRVVLSPAFAPSLADVKAKVAQGSILLAPRSVLLLDGEGVRIKNLRVSGAAHIKAAPGSQVVVDGVSVSNQGWEWTPLERVSDPPAKEEEAIRGFRVIKQETASYEITAPGEFTLPAVPAPAAV